LKHEAIIVYNISNWLYCTFTSS